MHVAGVRFTTLFILTHIKRFFIVFQTNYWTDVFVVRVYKELHADHETGAADNK